MDRRSLLRAAAVIAASRFIAPVAPAHATPVRADADPFRLGVASGEPTTDGFVLWTRLEGLREDAMLGFEIADDEGFRRIVRTGRAVALAGRGGAVHAEIGGLPPGRSFFYRFHFRGAVSRVGRTLTIAERPQRLRLALTSCQHWEQGWFCAYRDMVAGGVDAVLQVGDYIYEKSFGDGPNVRAFGAPDPVTLDDYRARHALYRSDPDLAAAHASLPFVVTWDDHEVENDYAGEASGQVGDPERFVRRRAAAYQAYFEHMPLRPSALRPDGGVHLYRRLSWPGLATLHVLDTRQHRTSRACSTPDSPGGQVVDDCPSTLDPAATMLGASQERWLREGLGAEQAVWSLVVQQTLFSRLYLPAGGDARHSDIWDGYEASRRRLLAAMRQPAVRNPIILGGDVHSFWLNDVREDFGRPATPPVATEVVTSCLASRNGPDALFAGAFARNPHVRFLDNAHAGYVRLEMTPRRLDIEMRAVADLADPRSGCSTLTKAVVEAGRPGVQA